MLSDVNCLQSNKRLLALVLTTLFVHPLCVVSHISLCLIAETSVGARNVGRVRMSNAKILREDDRCGFKFKNACWRGRPPCWCGASYKSIQNVFPDLLNQGPLGALG